jgi:type I restriction enzyme S subunit
MTALATSKAPTGFKQTEVGVIPTDWEVKTLEEIADVDPDNLGSNTSPDYAFKYISLEDVDAGTLRGYSEQVFRTAPSRARRKLKKGDVLVSTVRPNLRSHLFIRNDVIDTVCSTGFSVVRCKPTLAEPFFVYCHLFAGAIERQIEAALTGSNYPAINRKDVKALRIPYPKLEEQYAIDAVAADADVLIENLEKLIEKKRNIKQGAMQQLLTGKRRLPGFSGKWETKLLGEIGEMTGSGVDKKIRSDEIPVRLVNYLDVYHKSFIYSEDLHHQVTARSDQIKKCAVRKGDIFFTPSSEMPYDIGISAVAMEDIPDTVYSYHVSRLRLTEDWDLKYRAYAFKSRHFLNQAETFCEGSGKRYVLTLKTFRNLLSVRYPSDPEEQAAIASVLSDMDAEIRSLEQKLSKYRQIKLGMMQQLLTGKIRLI